MIHAGGEPLYFRDAIGELATEVALDLATDQRDFNSTVAVKSAVSGPPTVLVTPRHGPIRVRRRRDADLTAHPAVADRSPRLGAQDVGSPAINLASSPG